MSLAVTIAGCGDNSMPHESVPGVENPTAQRKAADRIQTLAKQAATEDKFAQFALAGEYSSGKRVPCNEKLAVELLEKSSRQGLAKATLALACFYRQGKYGPPNAAALAEQMIKKLLENGDPDTQLWRALELWNKASSADSSQADQYRQKAFAYLTKAANGNNHDAKFYLAMYFLDVAPKDIPRGLKLLNEAATGSYYAQEALADRLYEGLDVPKDRATAVRLYEQAVKAVEEDYAEYWRPTYQLAYCCQFGLGTQTNVQRAIALHTEAAKHGYTQSKKALATTYLLGQGVPRDDGKALAWAESAAKDGDPEALVIAENLRRRMHPERKPAFDQKDTLATEALERGWKTYESKRKQQEALVDRLNQQREKDFAELDKQMREQREKDHQDAVEEEQERRKRRQEEQDAKTR